MKTAFKKIIIAITFILAMAVATTASAAWPTTSEWIAMPDNTGTAGLNDPINDTNPGEYLDIAGDATYPSAYMYNDGDYIYFRIRLDDSPIQSDPDNLRAFGWGFVIDTDGDDLDYEWLVMIDGITDEVYLAENTTKTGIGDPSDKAETVVWSEDISRTVNFDVTVADTSFDGEPDYFLDFRIPYDIFKASTGITDSTPLRFFVGSSASAQTIDRDLQASSLIGEMTAEILPTGRQPTTATVDFVTDLTGTVDLTEIYPGETIYIKVTDNDENSMNATIETVTVKVTSAAGDIENVITLTETGVDTGIFTGSLTTTNGAFTIDSGVLEVIAIETVTVTYIDALESEDDGLKEAQERTDTLDVHLNTEIAVTKTVDNATPNEGDTITYTLMATNNGPNDATGLQITDNLPAGVTYVSDDGGGSYNNITGIWTIAALLNGVTTTLNINVTVDGGTDGTTITNDVDITAWGQHDHDATNDSDSVDITIGAADLAVTKVVDNVTPSEGDTITYTITVTNNGANDATGIELTETFEAGITYAATDTISQGTYNSGTGLWAVGGLINTATATLTLKFTVDAATTGDTITNTAAVTASSEADPDTSDNSATAAIVVGGADLSMAKSVDNATPNEGETITYTITITNNGTNGATGVVVTDTLPADITYASDVPSQGSYDDLTGLWTVGALANGVTATLTIDVTVNASTGGTTITNTATVPTTGDPDTDNNTASVDMTVSSADLEVTKSVSTPAPSEGDTIIYALTVTNNGPSDATNIIASDLLPTGVTYVSDDGGGDYVSGTGLWTIASILNGATATLNITVTVDAGTSLTTITNTALITSADQADPTSGNDSSSADISVSGADIEVVKTVDNPSPSEGETVTYTVTVTNLGPNDATGIELTDNLPTGVSHVSNTASQGSYSLAQDRWTIGDMVNSAVVTLTIIVEVDALTTGSTITNTAQITAIDQTDYDLGNSRSSVDIVVGATDISIAKSVDDSTPTEGDTITYTLTVTNVGPNDATTIVVADLLPSGLTYASNTPSQGSYVSGTGVWTVGDILNAATATLTITATVDAGTGASTITNTATITSADQGDPDTANNTATQNIVVQTSDLHVVKTGDNSTPNEGETITYTITVINNGPHDTTGIIVEDVLPTGVTYVSDDSSGGYVTATGLWTVGSLAKLAEATLNIVVSVDSGTGGTTITNTASINANDLADPTPGNDTSTYDISPTEWPELTVSKVSLTTEDPINNNTNPKAIPGATVKYTITVGNTGGATSETTVMTDAIPTNTSYKANSLTLDSGGGPVALTDTDGDSDGGDVTGGTVTVEMGDVTGGSTMTITFEVIVN